MTGASDLPPPPWPADEPYPRPSAAEAAARWDAFRGLLAEVGATVAVVAGHGGGRAEIQYLANAAVRWESLLVVPAAGDERPRLLVQLDNHAEALGRWSSVPVEVTGPAIARRAAALVRGWHAGATPIALLGPISERQASALRAELSGSDIVDIGAAFGRLRRTKSAEELAWTRYGAAICDRAVDTFMAEARPGMREDELGSILTSAVTAAGGQVGICFLASASMTTGGAAVPDQTWSRRVTGRDDLVMFELSAGVGGATGQVLRTVTLDGEPSTIVRRLHDVADDVFGAVLGAARPGTPVAAIERIGARIEEAGYTIVDDLAHGYGGGYLPPHVRTPATRREDPGGAVLEAGMLLVVQPNVTTTDRRHGVQTGELLVVTADGAESLHSAPRGLLAVGSRTSPWLAASIDT